MSQILDAINKAERQRQQRIQPTSREDLYKTLKIGNPQKRRPLIAPVSIALFLLCAGFIYIVERQNWFVQLLQPLATHINLQNSLQNVSQMVNPTASKQGDIPSTRVGNFSVSAIEQEKQIRPIERTQGANSVELPTNRESAVAIKNSMQNSTLNGAIKIRGYYPESQLVTLTPIVMRKEMTQSLKPLTPINSIQMRIKTVVAQKMLIGNSKSLPVTSAELKNSNVVSRETKQHNATNTILRSQIASTAKAVPKSPKKSNLHVTAIVYHPNPAQRFAFIHGQKIFEGHVIPDSNTVVVKILPKNLIVNDGSGDVMIR